MATHTGMAHRLALVLIVFTGTTIIGSQQRQLRVFPVVLCLPHFKDTIPKYYQQFCSTAFVFGPVPPDINSSLYPTPSLDSLSEVSTDGPESLPLYGRQVMQPAAPQPLTAPEDSRVFPPSSKRQADMEHVFFRFGRRYLN
ncbi:hypothetical protein B566_EDAN010794 [Ephemera danica]|nr:hypothetical protein B566_EDAN010794 [Ephemera danica]